VSVFFTQCPGDTAQTGTGKVDPARKFKCTTAARKGLKGKVESKMSLEITFRIPLNKQIKSNI